MIELLNNKYLVLFDGICNLCNASVQFIIKHDKNDEFKFASIQSEIGQKFIDQFQIDTQKKDSIVLYSDKNEIYYKSTAVLKIAYHLGFPRNILVTFIIIPPFIRDWVYDYIAKNRYKWYGKRKSCMVPNREVKSKFI